MLHYHLQLSNQAKWIHQGIGVPSDPSAQCLHPLSALNFHFLGCCRHWQRCDPGLKPCCQLSQWAARSGGCNSPARKPVLCHSFFSQKPTHLYHPSPSPTYLKSPKAAELCACPEAVSPQEQHDGETRCLPKTIAGLPRSPATGEGSCCPLCCRSRPLGRVPGGNRQPENAIFWSMAVWWGEKKIVFYISFFKWPSKGILFLGHTQSTGVLSHTTPPGQPWWAGGPRILLLPWEREGQAKGSITDNGNMPWSSA